MRSRPIAATVIPTRKRTHTTIAIATVGIDDSAESATARTALATTSSAEHRKLDLLEDIEPVHPTFPVVLNLTDEDRVTLDQLAVLLNVAPNDVLLELLHRNAPSPNGHAYEVLCSGCGLPFQSHRRPLPGKRHWCDSCKAKGEPGAQRARDYRDRKAGR
jgi:hypothetical protein